MKRYIYTTLLVFAILFCQAFGAQNERLTFEDTVCVKPGQTIHMLNFKPQILELLQNREDSIWLGCCDSVSVELEKNPKIELDRVEYSDWPDLVIDKNKEVVVTVTYKRHLTCSKIPLTEKEANMSPASLAMWYFFGKLLSETDTKRVATISDVSKITTLHHAKFYYVFELAFPENIDFKIQGDSCFNGFQVELSIDSAYLPYDLKWQAEGVAPDEASGSPVKFWKTPDDNYIYSILCTAKACKGETRSAWFNIGNPTPLPRMEDINCIASSENSFVAKVKNADSRLSYHWVFEESGSNREQQYSEGDSVTFAISPNMSGVLRLISTGGCRASDTVSRKLHRSVMAGNIRLDGDTNCLFGGDSLSLVLQNAPQEHLVWRSKAGADTLLWNAGFVYRTNRTDTGVLAVSVFSKYCPEDTAVAAFNIRKDLVVSIDPNESCISAYAAQTFKAIGNGIHPEIFWNRNGVEIDTVIYGKKDSVQLRLTNPGGDNLFVAVMAKECGRESEWDTLVLRPKPETPSFDTLWGTLTPCIPLGMADTIELRVQPQEGVKFNWDFSNTEKFYRIAKSDSHSIRVVTNLDLLDSEEDKTIDVNIYAYTEGCLNGSDTLSTTLYATGAGLGKEWNLIQVEGFLGLYSIGFSDDGESIKYDGFEYPFDEEYIMLWSTMEEEFFCVVSSDEVPLDLSCKVTSVERQCYSVYSIEVVDMPEQQDALFAAKKGGEETGKGRETESLQIQASFEKKDTPCSGIVLHPNPVHAGVQVKVEGICETESFTVECYSQQGKCLFRTSAKGDTFTIPTGSYAAGVYIIRIQPDGAATPIIKKLIII